MDTRNVSPGLIAAVIVVVVAIAAFLIYKGTSVKAYTGPPINMGAAMQGARTSQGGTNH